MTTLILENNILMIKDNKKVYPSGVSIQEENFVECIPELKNYVQLHWEELGVTKDHVPVSMDWDRYAETEHAGKLHTVTVRKDGKLIGYHVAFIGTHFHYKDTLHAHIDLYFIHPEYRVGRTGLRMFQFVEKCWKRMGVVRVVTSCKVHFDHHRLFEHMGYHCTDKVFMKILKE